jgi:hypothetical protein
LHREEVWLELQNANARAASPSDEALDATVTELLNNEPSSEDPRKGC